MRAGRRDRAKLAGRGTRPIKRLEERTGHDLPGVEGTYSHTTLAMELKIAESLQSMWEASLTPVIERREFGPTPRES
ncbi:MULTISPECIES: hypothetical protein [unclassified Streptomyces]|uniref:hypothetical protein n=1 Tax=unclassified Streptomyces TaxID=2593676 RepID=UPI002DD928CB|nr:hypothetical protein [Streptomyces sp. NBC_01775]WSB80689.1 hypothetical protein OHB04_36615 [Streptomyces sp. NBC_01775]WSS39810.1 hypothetical protein OG220_03730 [Streptomyces sp. NBC_01187]